MKKKILLFVAIIAMLVCLFAISASAATETIDGLVYDLNSNGTARLGKNANQNVDMETIIIPEKVTDSNGKEYTVTEIYEGSFRNNKTVKYISLPPTITFIGGAAFNSCSNLVFIDFNDNQNNVSMTSWGVFRDCTSLMAVCLPDNMKTIGDQAFTNCKALTAVYLPANVEHIKGNKSAGDGPAFGNSPNLYLVNDKFEVRDENGNFYTADTFKLPAKPEIYYFPSTLKTITGPHNTSSSFTMDENGMVANTGMEDCAFYNLPNINSVLVLPESYTGYDDRTISGGNAQITDFRGDTISSGLFQKCGTKESPLTIVFLGKIDRISMGRKGEYQYTTFVFANEANTGFENTKIGTWYNTSDTTFSNQNELYAIFCHANNGEGAKYKIAFKGSADNNKYPELTSELQEDASIHTVDVKANEVVSDPTCVLGTVINTFCFCGKGIDTNKEIANTALGHEYDLNKGATKDSVVYANYLADGILNVKCARCDECSGSAVAPIIAQFKGFSVNNDGDAITLGYVFNDDAIKEFEEVNGTTVEFGFVAGVKALLGDKMPLDEGAANVVKAVVDNKEYVAADFILRGNWDRNVTINEEEVDIKDVEFYMAGYILVGDTVAYLNANGSSMSAGVITFATCDVPETVE
ncbi:MAG: leucine-rich repeat domain-containing protein [Clostridia bacterium]|nr:leucine-rich repeat domain-containing protein [Clostridia bacterium]